MSDEAKVFRIEVACDAREVYYVQTTDVDEARRIFNEGEAGDPSVSEITGGSIESIEEVDA